jgi:hypothetical protein
MTPPISAIGLALHAAPPIKESWFSTCEAQRLAGYITPSIGNLTYLTGINLINNSIYGEIPQEVGRLRRLKHLNLTFNSFGGNLPTNLSHCTQLTVLNVGIQQPCWADSRAVQLIVKVGHPESWWEQPYRKYPVVDRKLFFFVYACPSPEQSTREHT